MRPWDDVVAEFSAVFGAAFDARLQIGSEAIRQLPERYRI